MPGRQANPGSYRYGFQNQETDPEMLSGAVAFKYRVHDPRIGRFLSVDPLAAKYPYNSPYAFSENRLIDAIELEGLEKVLIFGGADLEGKGLSETMQALKTDVETYSEANNLGFEVRSFNTKPGAGSIEKGYKFIKDNYKKGETIILYGYSIGGGVANEIAKKLKEDGINVELLVTIDAAASVFSKPLVIPDNVDQAKNYYQTSRDNIILSRGYPTEKASGNDNTDLNNYNYDNKVQKDPDKGSGQHGAMDEDTKCDVVKTIEKAMMKSTSTGSTENNNPNGI